jgi:hypothetical protein
MDGEGMLTHIFNFLNSIACMDDHHHTMTHYSNTFILVSQFIQNLLFDFDEKNLNIL